MLTRRSYERILSELIKANKNNDIVWFSNKINRKNCDRLMSQWDIMNQASPNELYKRAKKKLIKLLKATRSRERFERYLKKLEIENERKNIKEQEMS